MSFSAHFWMLAACAGAQDAARVEVQKRVLVYTVSAGFEHDVTRRPEAHELSIVEQALVELGRAARFEAVPTRDASAFEPASLTKFDAVFFYTTGDLPLSTAQRDALFAFVARGGGFAGVHSATDTYPSVPEFGTMIGARFDGHPWHEKVRVNVVDPSSPVTRHLGASFEIEDEIYQFAAPYDRARLRVLLTLDTRSIDVKKEGVHRTDGDFALAWTKPFGKGRVFYTALGHRPEVWKDERFLRILAGGLAWSMRVEERPKLSASDELYRSFASAQAGDARKGHDLYRRESGTMCARCHVADAHGARVGPNLEGVALRLAPEEILDAILAPSASIDPQFAAVSLELADETLAFGRIVTEGKSAITLADTNGTLRVIPASQVIRRTQSPVSVMPEGVARTLSREEFADLYAYVLTLTVPAAPVTPK